MLRVNAALQMPNPKIWIRRHTEHVLGYYKKEGYIYPKFWIRCFRISKKCFIVTSSIVMCEKNVASSRFKSISTLYWVTCSQNSSSFCNSLPMGCPIQCGWMYYHICLEDMFPGTVQQDSPASADTYIFLLQVLSAIKL